MFLEVVNYLNKKLIKHMVEYIVENNYVLIQSLNQHKYLKTEISI